MKAEPFSKLERAKCKTNGSAVQLTSANEPLKRKKLNCTKQTKIRAKTILKMQTVNAKIAKLEPMTHLGALFSKA